MNESLTILLPVRNAEQSLAHNVSAALEIAAELTPQFEVAIIDDASTDATEEIACDLAIRYPQVIVARHPRSRGTAAAIQSGMLATTGEVVMVQPQDEPLRAGEIRRLWYESNGQTVDRTSAPGARRTTVIDKLVAWGQALRASQSAGTSKTQLIRRDISVASRLPRQATTRVDKQTPALPTPAPSMLTQLRHFALGE